MEKNIPYTEETILAVNGIQLAYDAFGDPAAPPILLIMGLGAQMISWDEDFCSLLAGRGYRVIRFDNRDVGHSSKFDEHGMPDILALMQPWMQGEQIEVDPPYSLVDMAADTAGLIAALGYRAVHVVGISLGGMIAQILCIHHPDRVRTLTSMMSMTGDMTQFDPDLEALTALLTPSPLDREGYIAHSLQSGRIFRGPRFPYDEGRARLRAGQVYDRGLTPAATPRQISALIASLGWRESLPAIQIPTLVLHGDADPIIPVEGGIDTAKMIPGARLMVIEGLGHEMPPGIWPEMIDAITRHAKAH